MNETTIVFNNQLEPSIEKLEAQLFELSSDDLVRIAKGLCPVDSGELQESIVAEGEGGHEPELWLGSPVDYALYVEMGTQDSPAQPFLRPALETLGDTLAREAK